MSKIVMAEQSSAPDTPGSGKVAIYVDTDGSLCWRKDDGVIVKIASAGTYTLTIPATGTAALLGTAQTFSAAQTFGSVLTAPGIKPASNSTTAIQLQNAGGTAILTVDTTNSIVDVAALKIGGVDVPYATGTWTPALTADSGSGTYTSSGLYVRIGKLAAVWFTITLSSKGTLSGDLFISDLPFSQVSLHPAANFAVLIDKITLPSATTAAFVQIGTSTSARLIAGGSTGGHAMITAAALSDDSIIRSGLIYQIS